MKVALFCSRLPQSVAPPPWLPLTFALCSALSSQHLTLLTSLGTPGYDAALAAMAYHQGDLEILLPPGRSSPEVAALFPTGSRNPLPCMTIQPAPRGPLPRDQALLDQADLAIGLWIRPNGNLFCLLLEAWKAGRAVAVADQDLLPSLTLPEGNRLLLETGLPPLSSLRLLPSPGLGPLELPPVARAEALPPCWRDIPPREPMLTHYTRACPGPWPGQSPGDYWLELWLAGPSGRRDGLASLQRMVAERRLRASSRLIRGQLPVVCFTALNPDEAAACHRYQRHLRRWDFASYGLALPLKWLKMLGVQPVMHLPASAFRRLSAHERPFFQKLEPPECDYVYEQEWRVVGDVDFSRLPLEALRRVSPPEGHGAGWAGSGHISQER